MKYGECGAKCRAINKHDKWWCMSSSQILQLVLQRQRRRRWGWALSLQPSDWPVSVQRRRRHWWSSVKNISCVYLHCASLLLLLSYPFPSFPFLYFAPLYCDLCSIFAFMYYILFPSLSSLYFSFHAFPSLLLSLFPFPLQFLFLQSNFLSFSFSFHSIVSFPSPSYVPCPWFKFSFILFYFPLVSQSWARSRCHRLPTMPQ